MGVILGVIYLTCTRLNSLSGAVRRAFISCVDVGSGPSTSDDVCHLYMISAFIDFLCIKLSVLNVEMARLSCSTH